MCSSCQSTPPTQLLSGSAIRTPSNSGSLLTTESLCSPIIPVCFTPPPLSTIIEIFSMLDLCLEEPSSANGAQLRTAGCNGGLNQVWNLV